MDRVASHLPRMALPHVSLLKIILRLDASFRERAQIERLDAHILRDIGLTKEANHLEHGVSAWNPPQIWRKL